MDNAGFSDRARWAFYVWANKDLDVALDKLSKITEEMRQRQIIENERKTRSMFWRAWYRFCDFIRL